MADDVKVRFSAEGIAEVIEAFKRIQEEAKKTGEEGSKSFEAMKEAMSELGKEFVGFLAIGAVVEKTKELFSEVLNGAVALDKLHQTTGMSTDALQALGAAAKETMIDSDSLNRGLQFFARTMGQAEEGSKKATAALANVGLQLKDLKGLNSDQQFDLVAKRLAEIEDPAKRAAAGAAIFGKQFLQIEPAIIAVADEGFGHFTDKLKELGVYLDGDAIAQMKSAKQGLNEIGEEAKGLATQFLVGLMPAVRETMDSFIQETSSEEGGIGAMKKLGQIVGAVVETIVAGFEQAGSAIGSFAAIVENHIVRMGASMDALKSGNFKALVQNAKEGFAGDAAIWDQFKKDTEERKTRVSHAWGVVTGSEQPTPAPKSTDGAKSSGDFDAEGADPAKVGKARLALQQAQLEAELHLYEAQSKLKLDAEKQSYEQGKLSLQQYFADRATIIGQKYDKEIEIIKLRRAAVVAAPIAKNDDGSGALQKQTELAKLDGELAVKQVERQEALTQLTTEERAAQQKNYEQKIAAEQKLLVMEGKKAEAARLALDLETQKLALELKKSGAPQSEVSGVVANFKAQGEAKISYDETKQDANTTLAALNTSIKQIQDQVKNGTLFPVQGEQKIIDLEKQRLPILQDMAQKMIDLAKATGDATNIQQADAFKEKIDEIALSTDDAAKNMADLKKTAQDSLQNGLSQFLYSVATGAQGVGQAFDQMALQFVEAIAKMEAQYLASQAIKWLNGGGGDNGGGSGGSGSGGGLMGMIGGLFGGGGDGGGTSGGDSGASDFFGAVSSIASLFAADGGHIRGPGSSTSDSIPAMLSDGEFVVNAGSVQKPGVLALLHAINGTPGYSRGQSPGVHRYATGGAVTGGSGPVNHYHVDASGIPPHLINEAVRTQVLDVIAKNPAHVRNSLG